MSKPGKAHASAKALGLLFEENVALYFELSRSASVIYRRGDISGPRRTVLVAIARNGPETVARLAKQRATTRQRLQPLVNGLVREGLLALSPNPMHRRSPVVTLTAKGKRAVERLEVREAALRKGLRPATSAGELTHAARVLREVRLALAAQLSALVRQRPEQ